MSPMRQNQGNANIQENLFSFYDTFFFLSPFFFFILTFFEYNAQTNVRLGVILFRKNKIFPVRSMRMCMQETGKNSDKPLFI